MDLPDGHQLYRPTHVGREGCLPFSVLSEGLGDSPGPRFGSRLNERAFRWILEHLHRRMEAWGLDGFNGKASGSVVLATRRNLGVVEVVVLDTQGGEVERGTRIMASGVHRFAVLPSGLVMIRKKT